MDKPRTLEEIKSDIRSRVGHRAPFNHADKKEAEEVLSKLNSVEGEVWAAAWNELGARWEEKARTAEAAGDRTEGDIAGRQTCAGVDVLCVDGANEAAATYRHTARGTTRVSCALASRRFLPAPA